MLALPKDLPLGTPLVRLTAQDTLGNVLHNTHFQIGSQKVGNESQWTQKTEIFNLKTLNGRALVINNKRLIAGSSHTIFIRSTSSTEMSKKALQNPEMAKEAMKYQTNFLVFVSVSKYPF